MRVVTLQRKPLGRQRSRGELLLRKPLGLVRALGGHLLRKQLGRPGARAAHPETLERQHARPVASPITVAADLGKMYAVEWLQGMEEGERREKGEGMREDGEVMREEVGKEGGGRSEKGGMRREDRREESGVISCHY